MRQIHWSLAILATTLLCVGGFASAHAKTNGAAVRLPSSQTAQTPAQQVAQGSEPQTAQAPPPQTAQAPVPTDVKSFDDWTVRCFPIKSLAQCDLFQATVDKATQRRIVSTSIAYVPSRNGYMGKIIIPLGVQVAGGITIDVDKYKSAVLAITRCEDDGCYIEGLLDAVLIEKLATGKSAGIVVTLTTGGHATLPLSLRGFSGAIAAMKQLATEKAR
jgi:invasion protein IalB